MARWGQTARLFGRALLDFALPPRCAGCLAVVDEVDRFCADCWPQLQFLGVGGCQICGIPLEATEADHCAACLARPPPIDRSRAAVAYGELPRAIALRLKYGRKVALARTMARYMAPLREASGGDALVVPVPLHRARLWTRGFNQALLVARHLSQAWGLPIEHGLLRRTRNTQSLKGLSASQRRRAVGGAFAVAPGRSLAGRTVILVDDVLTTGSTAEACARVLRKAGADRVELVSWARVVRPRVFMR